jgi:hypothetical protein
MNRTATIVRSTAVGALVMGAAFALPMTSAEAAKAGSVIKSGSCSARADWKLKASPDNGRIEVEAEVDSNVNGQSWNWRLRHNGSLTASGTKSTRAPSGSFTVQRTLVNVKGPDTIVFKATNPKSGETCVGKLIF